MTNINSSRLTYNYCILVECTRACNFVDTLGIFDHAVFFILFFYLQYYFPIYGNGEKNKKKEKLIKYVKMYLCTNCNKFCKEKKKANDGSFCVSGISFETRVTDEGWASYQ